MFGIISKLGTFYKHSGAAALEITAQVLRFYGFFQETVTERPEENARYRHVSIMFHMEDGTMSMHEPKVRGH